MKKLILIYWGTIFLMYLSQTFYPAGVPISRHQTDSRHFMRQKSDVLLPIIIFWLTSFSFLRINYNDSPLSSKRQKNNCMARHLAKGAIFRPFLQGHFFLNKNIL